MREHPARLVLSRRYRRVTVLAGARARSRTRTRTYEERSGRLVLNEVLGAVATSYRLITVAPHQLRHGIPL